MFSKKYRSQSFKKKWLSKCLIVATVVLFTTWMSPNPSKVPYPSDAPIDTFSVSEEEIHHDVCEGRRVHMYDMPSDFNTKLLTLCEGGLVPWIHFCKHFRSFGFGEVVNNTAFFPYDWYRTDAYMLEVIFFDRMLSYPCLTSNPANADIFFVPFFAGLDALPYLYNETLQSQTQGYGVISWLKSNANHSWLRYGGQDHFMIAGRTGWDFGSPGAGFPGNWGTHLFDLGELQNVTFMVLERRPWRSQELAIPYPVGFHPSSSQSLNLWISKVRSSRRTALFSFSGALRPQIAQNIRGILSNQCVNASTECARLDCGKISCSHNPEPIYESLLQADFCLQPRGDTSTRRSTIDSIVAGCIPVLFHEDSAATQYLWHFPEEYRGFSVFISEECVVNGTCVVRDILRKIPQGEVLRMREKLVSMIPSVVYKDPGAGDILQKDAFDLTIEGMVRKVSRIKKPANESSGKILTSL